MSIFSNNLMKLLKENELSLEMLSNALAINLNDLNSWLNETTIPKFSQVRALAHFFELPISYFYSAHGQVISQPTTSVKNVQTQVKPANSSAQTQTVEQQTFCASNSMSENNPTHFEKRNVENTNTQSFKNNSKRRFVYYSLILLVAILSLGTMFIPAISASSAIFPNTLNVFGILFSDPSAVFVLLGVFLILIYLVDIMVSAYLIIILKKPSVLEFRICDVLFIVSFLLEIFIALCILFFIPFAYALWGLYAFVLGIVALNTLKALLLFRYHRKMQPRPQPTKQGKLSTAVSYALLISSTALMLAIILPAIHGSVPLFEAEAQFPFNLFSFFLVWNFCPIFIRLLFSSLFLLTIFHVALFCSLTYLNGSLAPAFQKRFRLVILISMLAQIAIFLALSLYFIIASASIFSALTLQFGLYAFFALFVVSITLHIVFFVQTKEPKASPDERAIEKALFYNYEAL